MDTLLSDTPLLLFDSLFSGQTFRWIISPNNKHCFISVIQGSPVILIAEDTMHILVFSDTETIGDKPLRKWAEHYLTIDIKGPFFSDVSLFFSSSNTPTLLMDFNGLKVLREDPFETAVTFMCAQGIGMPIIRRQVMNICRVFGDAVTFSFEGNPYTLYGFPSPERLAAAHPGELRLCTNNNCARASNVRKMAEAVASGRLDFRKLAAPERSLDIIREELCGYDGIGPKIADCIALFGLGRFDAFPIDTHVRQYLYEWFGLKKAAMALTAKNYMELQREIRTILNPDLAGYAGHLLFHCWRKRVKRLDTA
ncbi:MAG: DNA-3-methyladenine glycosylase 2 family protein [Chlorobiaceae bacterium]|nr:DNA-3-methyladenine glycosylase 2 family protein [Chlorobiaceae bacterium]